MSASLQGPSRVTGELREIDIDIADRLARLEERIGSCVTTTDFLKFKVSVLYGILGGIGAGALVTLGAFLRSAIK